MSFFLDVKKITSLSPCGSKKRQPHCPLSGYTAGLIFITIMATKYAYLGFALFPGLALAALSLDSVPAGYKGNSEHQPHIFFKKDETSNYANGGSRQNENYQTEGKASTGSRPGERGQDMIERKQDHRTSPSNQRLGLDAASAVNSEESTISHYLIVESPLMLRMRIRLSKYKNITRRANT
ncbi:hypothetical protein SDJN03_19552, partial [Cucurbita argyrosperma subsp. sororia]